MRDLTEKEINLAPDWATHYQLDDDDNVIYKDSRFGSHEGSKGVKWVVKASDITGYEFSDSGIEGCEIGGGVLTIYNPELTTNLDKDDVIAIAKALGVTSVDLI